jgi:ubiquinone biosynthesis accessory factor UbiJ
MLIKPILIATLETALNRYLALDNNKEDLLIPLKGKVIALIIQPFNETLYLCPTGDSIQIIDQTVTPPDTIISGSVWALGLMGLSAKPMRSVFSGDVKIEGDIQTGKQFQELFRKLNIDLEGLLAQYTGADIANRVSQFFRSGQEWSKETVETFKLNTTEFLQEETRDLPAKPEIDSHHQQVDELRNHFDRLNSRVERLADIIATNQNYNK